MIFRERTTDEMVFTHLPKTAGTSVRSVLVQSIPGARERPFLDRSTFGDFEDFTSLSPRARRLVIHHASELPEGPLTAGHLAPSTTRERFPHRDHLTILREPVARLVSAWTFNRSHSDRDLRHWGGYAARFALARAPLAAYLQAPEAASHVDNAMARQLLWPHPLIPWGDFIHPEHDEAILQEARAMLDTFSFVGLVEDPRLGERLGDWLGAQVVLPHQNRTGPVNSARPEPASLPIGCLEPIQERTRIDARLWRHLADTDLSGAAIDCLVDPEGILAAAPHDPSRELAPPARPLLLRRMVNALTGSWSFR